MKPRRLTLLLSLVLLAATLPAGGDGTLGDAAARFGFRGFEIYKSDRGVFGLLAADFDGDGLQDLLIVNNQKARLELFLRRKDPVVPAGKEGAQKANELADDRFFERKEVLTEKQVASVVEGDFNGDGKRDVAYYGKPPELVVLQGDGKGGFVPLRAFDIEDGALSQGALAAGDLNGDGRDDLVLLSKTSTAVFLQADGTLGEPLRLPNAAKEIAAVAIQDLDGDGRRDLVAVAPNEERSVRVRFQEKGGVLGPEVALKTAPWRGIGFDDIDPRPGDEALVLQRTSGLLRALSLTRRPAGEGSGVPLGTIRIYPFEESAKGSKERAMALGDVNGDGRVDVVVTEPGTAQIAIHLQEEGGRLGARVVFPSLANAEAVRLADLDGDGRPEIVVLSGSERAVGIAALAADGRLPFPVPVPVQGTPKTMDAGDCNGDGRADLVVVAERDKKKYVQVFLQQEAGGLGPPLEHPLESMKDLPDDLLVFDIDRDGRADLLFFTRYAAMQVWRGTEAGFIPVPDGPEYRGGLVDKTGIGDVNSGDLDGDGKLELLVASQNFARAIHLDAKGGLTVIDQVNGRSPRSQIRGVAALDLVGDGKTEVAVFDAEGGVITVLRPGGAGVYEPAASFSAGRLSYLRLFAADLDGDGRRDLVVQGKEGFGVLYVGAQDLELSEVHVFESPVRDAVLDNFAVGDLDGDGRPELVLVDSGNNNLEIVTYDSKSGFKHEIKWRVFEEKRHDGRALGSRGEPREILLTDLNGDGRSDIAVLVHDRLIVYLKE